VQDRLLVLPKGMDVITLPHRRVARRVVDRPLACRLVDSDTGLTVSFHPSIESAVAETRRIAAYRSARGLDMDALAIVPR
jgi:hypothetical protein